MNYKKKNIPIRKSNRILFKKQNIIFQIKFRLDYILLVHAVINYYY